MKKIWIIAGVVGIATLSLGAAGLAFAQSESPPPVAGPEYGNEFKVGRRGYGGMRAGFTSGEEGPYHEDMIEAFAEATGLSVNEIENRLEAGETMWQIAASTGLTFDEISAILSQVRSEMVAKAVAGGTLTQEQTDLMNQHMRGRAAGGFGPGDGNCMGEGTFEGFRRGSQGMWNSP